LFLQAESRTAANREAVRAPPRTANLSKKQTDLVLFKKKFYFTRHLVPPELSKKQTRFGFISKDISSRRELRAFVS
jgi:hypothetical protein